MDPLSDWKEISKIIRFENKNLKSRLQSIIYDYHYIRDVVEPTFSNYKIIPNERCGIWYYPPEKYEKTCYFKSTDGHTNIWEFSHRRLNFHILEDIFNDGGLVIIDSTRRGKKLPDSLSKTIPIWCCVINCIINESAPEKFSEYLFLPPKTVSDIEKAKIIEKLPFLVENCLKYIPNVRELILDKLSDAQKRSLEAGTKFVLRPIWIHPGLRNNFDPFTGEIIPWDSKKNEDFSCSLESTQYFDVCCCCCSYQCQDGVDKKNGYTYVQGAADDHELWSEGLEPLEFWRDVEFYSKLEHSDEDIRKHIAESLLGTTNVSEDLTYEQVWPRIYIGKNTSASVDIPNSIGLWIRCSFPKEESSGEESSGEESSEEGKGEGSLQSKFEVYDFPDLKSNEKKSGKNLRVSLIQIIPIVGKFLARDESKDSDVLITCDTGTDISVGIALTVICKNYSEVINKVNIRQNLTGMINKVTGFQINPSRATLNSVNSFLM